MVFCSVKLCKRTPKTENVWGRSGSRWWATLARRYHSRGGPPVHQRTLGPQLAAGESLLFYRPCTYTTPTPRCPRRSIITVLRVSGSSRPNSVAGAVAALLRSEGEVEVQAIGPLAVNQAVKAIAIARSYISEEGLDLVTQPSFVKLELQNEERTAVRFTVRSLQVQGE